MINKYLLFAVILAASTAVSGFYGYDLGVKVTNAGYAEAAKKEKEKSKESADIIGKANAQRNKDTAVKVRTIYVEKDSTGCLDTAIPAGLLQQLD